jgi:hypothetical protein
MLTDEEIDLLRKRAEKAVKSKWQVHVDADDLLDLIWLAQGGDAYNSLAPYHGCPIAQRVR